MKLFPMVIRRGGGSSSGFIAGTVNVALSLTNRFNLTAVQQNPAVSVAATRHGLSGSSVPTNPAVAATPLGAVGVAGAVTVSPAVQLDAGRFAIAASSIQKLIGVALSIGRNTHTGPAVNPAVTVVASATGTAAQMPANPAMNCSARISAFNVPETPAFDIVQVTYSLTRVVGAATQAAVGTTWTNPANATGLNDAVNATSVGSALGNTQGIELSYADSVGKAELTITSVSLTVYWTVTDALALCTRTLSYNIGAGLVTLATGTGSVAGPSSTFTLPITTWAQFDALQVRLVTAYAAASIASNATLDAAVVTVLANRTDAL